MTSKLPATKSTSIFSMNLEGDILHVHITAGANFTPETIKAYLENVRSAVGSRSHGVMLYGQDDVSFDLNLKEIVTSNPIEGIKAMAIVNPGNMATLQFAIYMLNVGKRSLVPLKIFNDATTAQNWLEKKLANPPEVI